MMFDTHMLYHDTDAARTLLFHSVDSLSTCCPLPTAPQSTLAPSLSEDWTAFCLQGSETQAVSAGNIFHSAGPTEALAATRYWPFQSLVLLGKYGSLWLGPLCRLGGRVGKDGCRRWRQLTDTARRCASQPAVAMRQHDRGFPLVRTLKRSDLHSLFCHFGLELSIPGHCLLVILIIEYFPVEHLETSFLQLSGKHSRAPSLMQSEKISEQLGAVGEHVAPLWVWIRDAVAQQRACRVKNWRYRTVLGHIILSRLHLTEGTGLRRGVETQAGWEWKSCRTTTAVSASRHLISMQTTENRHGAIAQSESVLNNTQIYCKWCGLAAFTDSVVIPVHQKVTSKRPAATKEQ